MACSASPSSTSPATPVDTDTNQADQTTDRHLSENVDAIIGAASSGVYAHGDRQDHGCRRDDVLAGEHVDRNCPTYDDNGLYFRTVAARHLPGRRARPVRDQRRQPDGGDHEPQRQLRQRPRRQATATIEESGGEVVERIVYDPQAQSFDSEVGQLAAADADAIILIGFNESSRILRAMVEQGIGPRDIPVYGSDGNIGNALGVDFDAGN